MPFIGFSSFSGGLASEQRSRGNLIANVDHDYEQAWVPYVDSLNKLIG